MANEARTELLPLRRDLDARQVALAEQEIKQWQELANRRRQQEAEQQVQQAAMETGQAHPAVRQLVNNNAELAATRKALADRIAEATSELEQVNQQLRTLNDHFRSLKDKVETVGLTNDNRPLLRKQRETLPNLTRLSSQHQRPAADDGRGPTAPVATGRRPQAAGESGSTDAEHAAKPEFAQQGGNPAELAKAVREALTTKRDYLDALRRNNEAYFNKLVNLDAAEQQLIDETDRCAVYIDERVLWIASTAPLGATDFRCAGDALLVAGRAGGLLDIGRTLAADAVRNPALFGPWPRCCSCCLVYWRRRFPRRVQEIGEKAARGSSSPLPADAGSRLLTAWWRRPWPGLMWYLGWRLIAAADASELCKALGAGLHGRRPRLLRAGTAAATCCASGAGRGPFRLAGRRLKAGAAEYALVQPAGAAVGVRVVASASGRGPEPAGNDAGTARWDGYASSRRC